jgi:hypothetical protein
MFEKLMENLISVEDKRKATHEILVECGERYAQEIGCPIEEVNVRVRFGKDGMPYYELFRMNGVTRKNEKIKDIHLSDIIVK